MTGGEMKKKLPKLTPVEWEIMEAVWALGNSPSVRDVLDHAYPDREKAYTTVQTVMNTLEKKGLLTRQKKGLVNFYTPTGSRAEAVTAEMSRMVARVFRGSVPAVASHLIESGDLSLKEIEAIRDLLDRRARELRVREKGGRRRG
jgi:predicted transcriptional regulator